MLKYFLCFITLLVLSVFGISFFTQSGVYFFLDTIFYPVQSFEGLSEKTLYGHSQDLITLIFGYQLYSKLLLLGVFLTGTYLGYNIGVFFYQLFTITDKKIQLFTIFLSIIFVVMNPFTYERFITQTEIILGIYFIGLGLLSLLNFIGEKNSTKLYYSSIFFGISLSIFPHAIIFLILIGLISISFYWKQFSLKNIFLSFLIILGINSNWMIGDIFLNPKSSIDKVSSFNYQNIEVFSSNSLSGLGTELTNLLLYGFWGERYKHLYTPEIINDKWYVAGFFILFIIIIGIITLYRKEKKLTSYLLIIGIISYILSLGISSDIFKEINIFFYNNLPYYIGMREPQKLTGLVMIIYSLFFITGVYGIYLTMSKYKLKNITPKYLYNIYVAFLLLFLLISSWSPNVLFGFNGQLRLGNYPNDFFQAKNMIQKSTYTDSQKYLILPWHSYISCKWTHGKIIANPTSKLFGNINTIQSDNIEIGNLYTNSSNKESSTIESFIKNQDYSLIKGIGITNIIFLDNCADHKKYSYLKSSSEVENVFESENLKIYNLK